MLSRARILIADDHTLVADACVKLLERHFDVVGTVGDGQALMAAVQEVKPDIIVLDIGMPLLNGLEAGKRIKRMMGAVRLVYLTMNTDLGIPRTIAFHKYKIMKCLRLRTSAQLVQYAIREHVVWPRS